VMSFLSVKVKKKAPSKYEITGNLMFLTNNVKTQGNCVIQICLLRFQKHVLLISTPLWFYIKKKRFEKSAVFNVEAVYEEKG